MHNKSAPGYLFLPLLSQERWREYYLYPWQKIVGLLKALFTFVPFSWVFLCSAPAPFSAFCALLRWPVLWYFSFHLTFLFTVCLAFCLPWDFTEHRVWCHFHLRVNKRHYIFGLCPPILLSLNIYGDTPESLSQPLGKLCNDRAHVSSIFHLI